MGNYIIDSEGFKEYFSPYGYEAYVLTGPLSRLGLKPEPEPKDAPLYLDLETGEGYFPEGVSAQKANDAAQYTKFWASVMSLCILEKIMNLGEKNSQSYSAWVMLVSSGMLIWMSMILKQQFLIN